MDETPIYFDELPGTTVAVTGSKQVNCRRTHSESLRVSVLLTVCADGTKLPPMLICKAKPNGNIERFEFTQPGRYPEDMVLICATSAFNNERGMKIWLERVRFILRSDRIGRTNDVHCTE
jgi:hypothetical protein